MRGVAFVSAASAAVLSAMLVWLRNCAVLDQPQVTPPDNAAVRDWLTRMDFFGLLNVDVQYPWQRRDSSGRFREVVQVSNEAQTNEVAREFGSILQQQTLLAPEDLNALRLIWTELLENVFHHAESPIGATCCAQTYPGPRVVEFGVADCGQTIAGSLRRNSRLRGRFGTAEEAIALAVEPRVTGRPSHNSGWGLAWTTALARENGGQLLLYSGEGAYVLQQGQASTIAAPKWPGTVVGLRIRMDGSMDLKAVMRALDPDPQGWFDPFE